MKLVPSAWPPVASSAEMTELHAAVYPSRGSGGTTTSAVGGEILRKYFHPNNSAPQDAIKTTAYTTVWSFICVSFDNRRRNGNARRIALEPVRSRCSCSCSHPLPARLRNFRPCKLCSHERHFGNCRNGRPQITQDGEGVVLRAVKTLHNKFDCQVERPLACNLLTRPAINCAFCAGAKGELMKSSLAQPANL